MRIRSNRDWHHLEGEHDDKCIFESGHEILTTSATDENKAELITAWNRRTATANTN
jgi:hypothetical protein